MKGADSMPMLKLLNLCMYFQQLEERATADCMPKLAANAYKQYCRYKMLLNARRAMDVG